MTAVERTAPTPVPDTAFSDTPLLVDRVAVVTGAANGIGAEIVAGLRQEGCHVVGVDIEDGAAPRHPEYAGRLVSLVCDVAAEDAVQRIMGAALGEFGRIDVLVNNAAMVGAGTVLDTTPAALEQTLHLNVHAPFALSKAVIEHLVASGRGGSLVNVASVNAFVGVRGLVGYSMSKAALLALTRSIAVEHAGDRIRCNAVAPGPIATRLNGALSEEERELRLRRIPLREFGTARDVAEAVVYLASDRASYVTGTTLTIDGGYLAHGTG